jgi:hypothetical protein
LAGCLLTAAAVLRWGYYDTYQSKWRNETVQYIDTHHRWSQNLIRRKMGFYNTAEAAKQDTLGYKEEFSLAGPMAGTGKPHGQWSWTLGLEHRSDAYKSHQPTEKTNFYWYGDEISEGEWHLRNRR